MSGLEKNNVTFTGAPFTSGSTGALAPLGILGNDPHNLAKYLNFIGYFDIELFHVIYYCLSYEKMPNLFSLKHNTKHLKSHI